MRASKSARERPRAGPEEKDEVKASLVKTEDKKNSYVTDNEHLNELELMNPKQTLIGCGEKGDDNALTCLIGTQEKWPEVTFDDNSTFVAGSKCLEGYEIPDRLCTLFLPTTITTVTQSASSQGKVTKPIEQVTRRIPEAGV